MKIKEIQEKVTPLVTESAQLLSLLDETTDLGSRIVATHKARLLGKIDETLDMPEEEVISELERLLSENWTFVKDNFLCYTACCTDDLTLLLCDIATFVAAEKNKKKAPDKAEVLPIQLLMPGLCLDSLFPDKIPSLTDPTLDLKTCLKTHIVGRDGTYLIPSAVLTLHDHAAHLEKIFNYYLDSDLSLSDDPVKQAEVKAKAYLDADELRRLKDHDSNTQAWFDIKARYDEEIESGDNLLRHLNTLVQLMIFNSTNGIGTEQIAAKGGMVAVSQFFEYYDQLIRLDEKNLEKIPESVRLEINTLKKYGESEGVEKDQKGNIIYEQVERSVTVPDASGKPVQKKQIVTAPKAKRQNTDTGSCLATRSAALSTAIKNHESILAGISLSKDIKDNRIQVLLQAHKDAIEMLKTSLPENAKDPLGITKKVVENFNIVFTFKDAAEITPFLNTLSADEIKEIFTIAYLPSITVEALKNLENFVMLIHGIQNLEKIKNIVEAIASKLITQKIIKDSKDLSSALISLPPEKIKIFLEALKENIFKIIKTADDFGKVLQYLNEHQRTAVCEALKDKLVEIIKTADDFRNVLAYLNEHQRTVVFEAFKSNLPGIIKTAYDFATILLYLNENQRAAFYEVFKSNLPGIIRTAYDFVNVLYYLNENQRTAVFEAFKSNIPDIIRTAYDFVNVLKLLNENQCKSVYEALKKNLSDIIKTIGDFKVVVFEYLSKNKHPSVCEALKNNFFEVIKTAKDLEEVLLFDDTRLKSNQKAIFCNALFSGTFPEQLINKDNISRVLINISPENCFFLVKNCNKDILKDFANSAKTLNEKINTIVDSSPGLPEEEKNKKREEICKAYFSLFSDHHLENFSSFVDDMCKFSLVEDNISKYILRNLPNFLFADKNESNASTCYEKCLKEKLSQGATENEREIINPITDVFEKIKEELQSLKNISGKEPHFFNMGDTVLLKQLKKMGIEEDTLINIYSNKALNTTQQKDRVYLRILTGIFDAQLKDQAHSYAVPK